MPIEVDEVQNLALMGRVKKVRKKRGLKKAKQEETCSFHHGKKDLSHVTCFRCHMKGYYASQCP